MNYTYIFTTVLCFARLQNDSNYRTTRFYRIMERMYDCNLCMYEYFIQILVYKC
jgi:hypothetical protein